MAAMQWSENLSVDIQEIDLQHRHLLDLFADLEQAIEKGAGKDISGRVIRELNSYVREHFTLEERWMARHFFPGLKEHALQHERFVEKLLHFELDHLGGNAEISRDLLGFLEEWLTEHLMAYDQDYARYFREKGVV